MMKWWQRLPGRLLEEDAALHALRDGEAPLVLSHRWTRQADGEPRLRVALSLTLRELELEVRFPPHYPEGCPSVRPVPDESLSSHQFRDGVLCLELGPDNWHPHYHAADMVASAWRLVAGELISTFEPIDIPSRHAPDLAERLRLADGVLVRLPGLEQRVSEAQGPCDFDYVLGAHGGARLFPTAFPKGNPLPNVPPALARETAIRGRFGVVKQGAPAAVPTESQAFGDFLRQHVDIAADEPPCAVLLRLLDGRTSAFFRFTDSLFKLVDMTLDPGATHRTPDGLADELSKRKIAIVGLGSVGSRVALSLARTGGRRFVLVDGDVLQASNLCRFPAGYAHVGATKVRVVKGLLRDACYTEPDITTHAVHIAAATNPELHGDVLESLATADILIDATANADAFGLLAMVASDNRRPLVWGEVFGGGLGGMVVSAQPQAGPCPRCVRAGLNATMASWPSAPSIRATSPYAADDEQPLVATDADVAAIAALLTQRTLEAVRADSSSPAAMLIGFRKGWVFDTPWQRIAVPVRADDWSCGRCWRMAQEPDATMAAQAEALFADTKDAQDPPAR